MDKNNHQLLNHCINCAPTGIAFEFERALWNGLGTFLAVVQQPETLRRPSCDFRQFTLDDSFVPALKVSSVRPRRVAPNYR